MALVQRNGDVGVDSDGEKSPVLEKTEARQGDGALENFRVLDLSLFLAVLTLGVVGVVVAILLR